MLQQKVTDAGLIQNDGEKKKETGKIQELKDDKLKKKKKINRLRDKLVAYGMHGTSLSKSCCVRTLVLSCPTLTIVGAFTNTKLFATWSMLC